MGVAGVAPRAGAWIETPSIGVKRLNLSVAPRAGAWIETSKTQDLGIIHMVAPRAGAWIETTLGHWLQRGLESLPARERGLKLNLPDCPAPESPVAPRAGAWIETKAKSPVGALGMGRSPRGSVD